MISGILAGQFLGHSNWDSYVVLVCVAIGYFAFRVGESVARIWNTNSNFSSIPDNEVPEPHINKDTMEEESVDIDNDVTGPAYATKELVKVQQVKDKTKRKWMLGTLFVVFWLKSWLDGLYLTLATNVGVIVAYYLNGVMLSIVIYSTMIHCFLHALEGKRRRIAWWAALTALWSLIYFSGSLFALCNVPWANYVLNHNGTIVIFSLSSGVLWRVLIYFDSYHLYAIDTWDTFIGESAFFVGLAVCVITSVFI